LKGTGTVLYRLPELIAAKQEDPFDTITVYIAEGEKDVDRLLAEGLVATCNPMGAGKWKSAYNEHLADINVVIVADYVPSIPGKDEDPGFMHAAQVYDSLTAAGCKTVRVVRAKTGKDAFDHFEAGHGVDDFVPLTRADLPAAAQAPKPAAKANETPLVVPPGLVRVLGVCALHGPVTPPTHPGGDFSVCCPVHEDKKPSATVRVGTDRPVVFTCHTKKCTQEQFFQTMVESGVPLAELMEITPEAKTERPMVVYSAAELAALELGPPAWLVHRVLVENTFGPLSGPKKTLKTYVSMLLQVAMAKGGSFLGKYKIPEAMPTLSFVGEGGRDPHVRRLKRICDAMNVRLEDLPMFHVYDRAPITSEVFQKTLSSTLEAVQPKLTVLDPLYMYHPHDVDSRDLYKRGAMLGSLSTPCLEAGSSLVVVDHFNKTGSGNGLDRISMSGMAEWADTWFLLSHRQDAQVAEGNFFLTVEIGSRQWGGHTFDLNLSIGALDPETGEHDGRIRFEVFDHTTSPPGERKPSHRVTEAIEQALVDHPWQHTKSEITTIVGGNRTSFRSAWDALEKEGVITSKELRIEKKDGKADRKQVWGHA
jgi:hypothetical protein